MKVDDNIICIVSLTLLASFALFLNQPGIANTVVGAVAGYIAKSKII